MAKDKDYSGSDYFTGTPKVGKIPKIGKAKTPKITNSVYSTFGGQAPKLPSVKAPKTKKMSIDEAAVREITKIRDAAGKTIGNVGGTVLGAVGTFIDAVSSGLGYSAGKEKVINQLVKQGIVTKSTRAYLLAKMSGNQAPSAETVKLLPKVTVTDRARADQINKLIEDAANGNASAWLRGEKVSYGAQVLFGDKKEYTPEQIAAGIAYDIVNDPLSYAGAGFISGVKGAIKGGSEVVKAGTKAALKGQVSLTAAQSKYLRKTGEVPQLPTKTVKEPKIKVKKSEIETARALGVDVASEIERIRRLGTYTTTQIPNTIDIGPLKLNLNVGLVASSALEAGKKALLSSLRTDLARDTLADVLKGNVSRVAGTVIAREGEEWVVKTASGENVGKAASKKDAQEIAKEIKKTANSKEIGKIAVDDLPVATTRAAEGQETKGLEVPAEDGGTVTLELNTPHQASDGSVWVYDGTNVKVFEDMGGAQASLVQKAEAPTATVKKTKGVEEYVVRAGDYIETFKTKAEANAAAQAYNTGKTFTPARVSSGKKPALDVTPTPQFTFADIGKKKVTGKEGSALKKILKNIDNLASQTPGRRIRLAMENQRLLRRIIASGALTDPKALRYLYKSLRKDFDNAIKLAKVDGEIETPYSLLKSLQALSKQTGPDAENLAWVADLVSGIMVKVDNSLVSIGNLQDRFPDYIKDVPNYVAKQVSEKLQAVLDEAKRVATTKDLPAANEAIRYEKLTEVFGEELAKKVKATGILKGGTEEAKKKFFALEKQMLNQYENITYKNFDELVAGLRNGESVNADALLKIFKEIDPENQAVKSTTKAIDKGTGAMLRDIFLNDAVSSVAEMKRKVALAGDVEELLGISGISYDTLLAQAIKYMQDPTSVNAIELANQVNMSPEWIQQAITKESPAEQAKLFSDSVSPLTGRTWSPGDDMIAFALQEAWSNKFDLMKVIEQSEDYVETVSTLGQKVKKMSDESYVSDTGAVLPNVFTQADEFRVIMKVIALTRGRMAKGIQAGKGKNVLTPSNAMGKEKQLEIRGIGADKQIDELIYQMDLASGLLSFLGIRITRLKEANDFAFKADYLEEVAKAKAEGRPLNYNKKDKAHFAYLHMGDIFRAFTENDARDLLRQAFFPVATKETYAKNTLSFMGLGDAARRVLELDGKEMLVDNVQLVEELTNRILQKTPKMKEATSGFAAQRRQIATQMAEHLIKPETVAFLREAHLAKSIGSADRWVREAETISDDILTTLRDGMRIAHAVGETSDKVRLELVRQYLRRLALAGNLFAAQGGRYAEDLFNAYAMQFAQYGRLPVSADAPKGSVLKIMDDQEAKLLRTQLYMLDAKTAPEKAQIQAAAGLKYRKPSEIEATQNKLTLAQEKFEEVMSRIAIVRQGGKQEVAAWEKEYNAAKSLLNKARKEAAESGLSTFHYQAGKWIPSEEYNPDVARQVAEEMEAAYVAGQSGLLARTLADEAPVTPAYKVLSGKKLQAALKKENLILASERAKRSTKHGEDIAAAMTQTIGKYDDIIDEPGVAPMQELQELELKQLSADMEMPPVIQPVEELIPEFIRVQTDFGPLLNTEKNAASTQLKERFSSFFNKEDIAALLRKEETAGFLRTSNVSRVLTTLEKAYKELPAEEFADAMTYALSRGDIPKSVPAKQVEIAMTLRPVVDSIREAAMDLNKDGIVNALKRFGLSDRIGYNLDEKDLIENMEALFDSLPFVQKPGANTIDEQNRLRALAEMQDAGVHPFTLFGNLAKAISVAKAEQGLAANIVSNFGWKNYFDSFDEAVKAGWVGIEGVGAGQKNNIIDALGSPRDGALFPPEIANQVGAAVRHWNEMLLKPRNEIVRQISQWTGLAKVFMTVNRLGYHALNLASDLSTAMIRGVSPADIIMGSKLAGKYIARTLPAEYGIATDLIANATGRATALERQIRNVTRTWGKPAEDIAAMDAKGFVPSIKLVGKGGGVSKVKLDADQLVDKMTERGILEKNIFINAIQGQDDALILDARDLEKAKFGQKIGARVSQATQIAGKVGGDFASIYSNAIRAAHVYKILNSRVWRSVDEALDFAADEIAIFHPTNKSLGSFERRNSAVISSFYTWLRMAHVMVFKMVLENNRELYAINNALYYLNSLGGGQPQSRGTSYEDPEEVADWFRFRSGQLIIPGVTDEGALGIKTPFALYEVANTWQMSFDVAQGLNENITDMIVNKGLGVVARSGPIAGQIASKFALKVDPSTGQRVQFDTAGDVVAEFVKLLPALTGPAKGFFGVDLPTEAGNVIDTILGSTPKRVEQQEITPDQALIARLNNLLGVSAFQPESEASKKRAQQLITERENLENELRWERKRQRRKERRQNK